MPKSASASRILIVDPTTAVRRVFSAALRDAGFEVFSRTQDGIEAMGLLEQKSFDVLVANVELPRLSGLELAERARGRHPGLKVILFDPNRTVESAVAALRAGAHDFVLAPVGEEQTEALVETVRRHVVTGATAGDDSPRVIFESPQMALVIELANRVAESDVNVLISGESGVGKELVAQTIHASSRRGRGPLVDVNCAAISSTLMEAELFGSEKGAFTGADALRLGHFDEADRGTLLLDEIGELPLEFQAKLLRVLETGAFYRVGGSKRIQTDVRVLASTNRDLGDEVSAARFRTDLYYRLNTINIHVPPLRERREDIIPITRHLASAVAGPPLFLTTEAERLIEDYDWPGNVRQLRNAISAAAILSAGNPVEAIHLPRELRSATAGEREGTLKQTEQELIASALRESGWRRSIAAERLGISPKTLYRKIKLYGLEPETASVG